MPPVSCGGSEAEIVDQQENQLPITNDLKVLQGGDARREQVTRRGTNEVGGQKMVE